MRVGAPHAATASTSSARCHAIHSCSSQDWRKAAAALQDGQPGAASSRSRASAVCSPWRGALLRGLLLASCDAPATPRQRWSGPGGFSPLSLPRESPGPFWTADRSSISMRAPFGSFSESEIFLDLPSRINSARAHINSARRREARGASGGNSAIARINSARDISCARDGVASRVSSFVTPRLTPPQRPSVARAARRPASSPA